MKENRNYFKIRRNRGQNATIIFFFIFLRTRCIYIDDFYFSNGYVFRR